jgi:hypothetical protein
MEEEENEADDDDDDDNDDDTNKIRAWIGLIFGNRLHERMRYKYWDKSG